jgi:hypothetical protein
LPKKKDPAAVKLTDGKGTPELQGKTGQIN